ncbi:IS3 family transposase [Streptomyces gibsoniae]|uniref:IS3 family transposase n=1 Tax=Streptomyces gibsoniae TaxID=3075529 RepID=A0ABU2UA68_9ACTN|nr:IS3 family transposase [Streptomyces sp. DSM 41699]MDT0469960.1 IS3 family transposase [Streptomyces sp. DSM 41699]
MASQGFPARQITVLLKVSESGYYAWRASAPSPRALRRAWLTRLILDIHLESGSTYGYRRVRQELGHRYGIDISHTAVELIMKEAGIRGRAGRLHEQAPQEGVRTPSRRWTVDVLTFTTSQGPLYTAVVLDTASHRLIGWSTAPTAHPLLVHHALMAAITRAAHAEPAAQTAQTAHESLLACSFTERAGLLTSAPARGTRGDWYDHAVVGAFWDTVHRELDGPSPRPDTPSLKDRLMETFDRFTRRA